MPFVLGMWNWSGAMKTHTVNEPLAAGTRIGILGGTFDPIHVGHLILAEEAYHQLELDAVYLVPAGDPPHKQDRVITLVAHRLNMVELAIVESNHLWVSRIDADRPGPHYATEMVHLFRQEVGVDAELFFLMGLDSLRDFPTWHQPQLILEHCTLVAFSRPTITMDWASLQKTLPDIQKQLILLDMPALEIDSTTLRKRLEAGVTVHYQVPHAVISYIEKHGLYS